MKSLKKIRIFILFFAVACILCGVAKKEYKDVKNKAQNICYECIGIG